METMDKTYDPQTIERTWYQIWEKEGYFAPSGQGLPYTIMIPPPNVTGSLHMGHAFQDAIMDALIRYRRMQKHNTLWQVGTDHAGIATQMVVERKLAAEEGKNRHDLGREAFIKKIWEWKNSSGNTITRQLRRLGASVDWDSERFTMDDGFSQAVQEVFIRLYEQDLIYRGKRLVNWDPALHTAISDLEVISEDGVGHLWYFRYPLTDGAQTNESKDHIIVATTRPETMLGDSAVAVHPDDYRYKNLIGKLIILPITGRRIPIVADNYVDQNFGTGCVKITPAHDFNDYEVGKRHNLPLINVMSKDANILACAEAFYFDGTVNHTIETPLPKPYHHLNRNDARKKIVAEFDSLGLLEKIEDHALKLPKGDRSGEIIEPLLTDQWFVRTKPLAKPAIAAVEEGKIKFVPKQYENMYFSWMRDIKDWCISRQLWWGHRIPAWYDETGKTYVGHDESEIRKRYKIADTTSLTQDNDVLDTWFSSALWTFGTLGWPKNTERMQTFHPTDTLVTGFDIIFFWVARMIMMTMHFIKDDQGRPQVPFKTVYVHGLVRDQDGQKMSKSKGNVLDPLDLIDGITLEDLLAKRTSNMMIASQAKKIEKQTLKHFPEGISSHGTDALRFTFYSLASTGRDIKFDMGRVDGYRNFCNKIWNAARYVLMNTTEQLTQNNPEPQQMSLADRWIISRLQTAIHEVTEAIDAFRLDHASQLLYDFIWNEFCDWYLELSKPVLWDKTTPEPLKQGTRHTLLTVLESILKLSHPFMPYITEHIWQQLKQPLMLEGNTIMLQQWPKADKTLLAPEAEEDIVWIKGIITAVRNIRGEMNIAPGKTLDILLNKTKHADQKRLSQYETFLKKLAKLHSIQLLAPDKKAPMSATQIIDEMEVLVPMTGLINKQAEIARLQKEIDKLQKEIARLTHKLDNADFIAKAPSQVVQKEKEKLQKAAFAIEQLSQKQAEIAAL